MKNYILFYYDSGYDCPEAMGWLDIPMELFTSKDMLNARIEHLRTLELDDNNPVAYTFLVREVETISNVTCSASPETEAVVIMDDEVLQLYYNL